MVETFLANNRDPFDEAAEKDWADGDQWEAEQPMPRANGSGIGGRPSFFFEQKSCNLDSVDFMSPQRQVNLTAAFAIDNVTDTLLLLITGRDY